MEAYFKAPYDAYLAYAMYEAYEDGDESILDDLVKMVCPLIRQVSCTYARDSYKRGDRGEMEADALSEVLRVIGDKMLPQHPLAFTKFLRRVIRHSMIDSFNRLHPANFDFWLVDSVPHTLNNFELAVTSARIYREQIAKGIRDIVRSQIRFLGKEHEACCMILDCVVGLMRVDPRTIVKRKYKIHGRRCNYLIKYVEVLARAASWDILEDEREVGIIPPEWATGGGILCTFS